MSGYEDARRRAQGAAGRKWGTAIPTALMAATMIGILTPGTGAQAEGAELAQAQQAFVFAIPQQALGSALDRFADQTGISFAYNTQDLPQKQTADLTGSFTIEQGLARLLSGSGLTYRFTGAKSIMLIPQPTGGGVLLQPLVIEGRRRDEPADKPFETAGSGSHISREQIERFPVTSSGDIFKATPGVISASNRNGASMDVNIRGMQGQNRVKVAIDGTQQSTSTWRGYYGVDDRVYLDPDLIGGVDIEKGPSGGAEGAGVTGGVVSVRTLSADDIVKEGEEYGFRLRLGLHDNAISQPGPLTFEQRTGASDLEDLENYRGSVALATKQENFDLLFAATRRVSGNYLAGKHGDTHYQLGGINWPLSFTKPGEEVFNSSQDSSSFLTKGTLRWGEYDEHALEIGYNRFESKFGEAIQSVLSTQDNAFRQVKLSETVVNTYSTRYRWNPDDKLIDLRANLWVSDVTATTRSVGPALYFPMFGWIPADDPRFSETVTAGGDINNTSVIDTGHGDLTLGYGTSYSLEMARGQPYLSRLYTHDAGVVMMPMVGDRGIGSVFSTGGWDATSWLKLTAGLRYDYYKLEEKSPVPATVVGSYADKSGGRLNPSAGITVTPFEGIQLFVTYAEGVRPPSLRETIGSDSLLKPNPNLKAEVAKNWEYGVNIKKDDLFLKDDKVRLKVAFFENNYEDYISRVTAPPVPGGAVFTTENLESAQFMGFEVSGSYDAGTFFAEGSLTSYQHFEFCRRGTGCAPATTGSDYALNHMPPKFAASMTAGIRQFDGDLTLGGRVTRAGDRLTEITQAERMRTGYWLPYTVYDLFASYKISENATFTLNVDNLTNQYYIDALEGSMPSPGRTLRLGLNMEF